MCKVNYCYLIYFKKDLLNDKNFISILRNIEINNPSEALIMVNQKNKYPLVIRLPMSYDEEKISEDFAGYKYTLGITKKVNAA